MSSPRLNLVVAVCNNMGIGKNGTLPWPRIRKDMEFFKKITTETKDPDKKNVVIMGRKTYFSIPEKFRPLPKRINIVLSRDLQESPQGAYLARSLEDAVAMVTNDGELADKAESVHIVGGSSIYKIAMNSSYSCRLYLTRIKADFECDTFLPEIDYNKFHKLDSCEDVPASTVTEGDFELQFEVYDKTMTSPELDFNIIAAMCDKNRGIGLNNAIPWPSISKDYKHYMELSSRTTSSDKKCANIKGRLTWLSTCLEEKQRPSVLNIVVSNHPGDIGQDPYLHKIVTSFDDALEYLRSPEVRPTIDAVWVLGGTRIYQAALQHPALRCVYLTRIYSDFEHDAKFPEFESDFDEISLPSVEQGVQEENDIKYQFKVYRRKDILTHQNPLHQL